MNKSNKKKKWIILMFNKMYLQIYIYYQASRTVSLLKIEVLRFFTFISLH